MLSHNLTENNSQILILALKYKDICVKNEINKETENKNRLKKHSQDCLHSLSVVDILTSVVFVVIYIHNTYIYIRTPMTCISRSLKLMQAPAHSCVCVCASVCANAFGEISCPSCANAQSD